MVVCLSVCLSVFLGNRSLFFSVFFSMIGDKCKIQKLDRAQFFKKKIFFCQKWVKWAQNG